MASRRVALALGLALALSAPSALAAPTAAQRETARRLMDEGKERTRLGDKPRAIEAYQKAHELMKVPSTGVALAKAHLSAGHLIEARDVALEVVRMPHESGEPPIFEKSRREAKELEASIKPRIPTVRIVVKGGPATKVVVDDVEVAPLLLGEPVALDPGHHSVAARNADGVEARTEIDLAERDAKELELTLAAPSPAVVAARPPDKAGGAGRAGKDASGGDRSAAGSALVYGGFGLAVAGLAVGGVTGALTLSKAGDVTAQCENGICDPSVKEDLEGANSLATISTIGFAVGGAGVALGVVGLLLPRTKVETALRSGKTNAAFWFGPGSFGVRGSF